MIVDVGVKETGENGEGQGVEEGVSEVKGGDGEGPVGLYGEATEEGGDGARCVLGTLAGSCGLSSAPTAGA